MRFSKLLTTSALALLALAGCDPKDNIIVDPAVETTSVYVINEGPFSNGSGVGTVALFNKATKTVTPDYFQAVNPGRRLGNIVQSMGVGNGMGYIVVNGSNKIEVVTLPGFKSMGAIVGLHSPRYFLAVSATRGYVTQWGNYGTVRAGIKVVDLPTQTVVDSIATGAAPERVVLVGGRVYVANSGSNTVTVIDPNTNRVTATLPVGDAPNSFALDRDARLWVLCGGFVAYNSTYTGIDYTTTTPGSLHSIDPARGTITGTGRTFASNRFAPTGLQVSPAGDQLYFRAVDAFTGLGGIVRLGVADATLPALATPFIPGQFYGLGVDPQAGLIYTGTGTFSADKMIRFQPTGTQLDETVVGTGPNGFVFF
jgi:YVTN family beta-propeller protein